jgi:hypothetical protein
LTIRRWTPNRSRDWWFMAGMHTTMIPQIIDHDQWDNNFQVSAWINKPLL